MNKIVMITGASSGFGWFTALKFAKERYNIIATGRRKDKLKDLEKKITSLGTGVKIHTLEFDVRDNDEVNKAIESLPKEWKAIDILINNAGLAVGLDHIDKGNTDDWDRMVDTNIKGVLYVTRAVAPLMVKRNEGHIINIGSIAGKETYENGNVYCATKSAIDSLSKSMRIDLLKNNIKVTNVAPGMAETEFSIVRFKGDEARAKEVYNGIDAPTGDDIASVIYFCVTLPAHVCINDIVVTSTQQASVNYSYKRK